MNREIVQVRTSQDTKSLLRGVAQKMDLTVSGAIRVLVHEKAGQLGVTLAQSQQPAGTKSVERPQK